MTKSSIFRKTRARNTKRESNIENEREAIGRYIVSKAWEKSLKLLNNFLEDKNVVKVSLNIKKDSSLFVKILKFNNNYCVEMSSGTPYFLYSIIRPLSGKLIESDAKGEFIFSKMRSETSISYNKICSMINRSFYWFNKIGEIPVRHHVNLNKNQTFFASSLAAHAEVFLFCHEFSHLILTEGKEALYLSNKIDLLTDGIEGVEDQWKEELMCDVIALNLMIKSDFQKGVGFDQLKLSYMGAELSLVIYDQLRTYGVSFDSSHPPAWMRIVNLRKALTKIVGDANYFKIADCAIVLTEVFSDITKEISKKEFVDSSKKRDIRRLRYISFILNRASKKNSFTMKDYNYVKYFLQSAEGDFFVNDIHSYLKSNFDRKEQNVHRKFKYLWCVIRELPDPYYRAFVGSSRPFPARQKGRAFSMAKAGIRALEYQYAFHKK